MNHKSKIISLYEKKINWYMKLIIKKIESETGIMYNEQVQEIIDASLSGKVLINSFINKYYEMILNELQTITEDAYRFFTTRYKVPVFDNNFLSMIKTMQCYNNKTKEIGIESIVSYIIKNYSQDINYTSLKYKPKPYHFCVEVEDDAMVSHNLVNKGIGKGDYVVVDPSLSIEGAKTNRSMLFLLPSLERFFMLADRSKYCDSIECTKTGNCLTRYSVVCLARNSITLTYKISTYSDFSILGCDKKLYDQLSMIIPSDNITIDRHGEIQCLLETDYIKTMANIAIRNTVYIDESKSYKLIPANYNFHEVNIHQDYIDLYYVGTVIKSIKRGESMRFYTDDLENETDKSEIIEDLIHVGLVNTITSYEKKIDVSTINPVAFLKGFIMWFLHPFRKEINNNNDKKYFFVENTKNNWDTRKNNEIDINRFYYSNDNDNGEIKEIDFY